jgi:hypothetical protein
MKRQISVAVGVTLAGFIVTSAFAQSEPLTPHAWSTSPPTAQDKAPPQEVARAALMSEATPPASPNPIGASNQTMPATLSQRNDLLDHVPVMAWPLRLDAQQRQQIYQAVMADASKPVEGAKALKPAARVSFNQALEMRPLPQQVAQIDGLQGLQYIKAEDKVLLVRAPNRTVVDEITK